MTVISIQTRIGSYPKDTVIGLRNIISLAAGKTVVTAVYALYIIVVIGEFCVSVCMSFKGY
jgi:hypothetical protein